MIVTEPHSLTALFHMEAAAFSCDYMLLTAMCCQGDESSAIKARWLTAVLSLEPVGGSTSWRGCHWYALCNFLLAGGWWLWLNLGFSPCHQHYCVGIPRVPALRILCHILSWQLWTLPAGSVAWHNTDDLRHTSTTPPPPHHHTYTISPIRTLSSIVPSHSPLSSLVPTLQHPPYQAVIQQCCSICFSLLLLFSQAAHVSIMLCRSAAYSHRWHQEGRVICVGELRGC